MLGAALRKQTPRRDEVEAPAVEYVPLHEGWIEQICALERMSFPLPWSRRLFLAEFAKTVSLSRGLVQGELLLAQSFNHVVGAELHILNISVLPEYRLAGFGAKLLELLLEEAQRRFVRNVSLEVRRSNEAARRLYARFGFDEVGLRRDYYQDNREDALVLACELPARRFHSI